MGRDSCRRASLSSLLSALTSFCIWMTVSPPLMDALKLVRARVLLHRVLELASELLMRHPVTGIKESGYSG